MARRLCLALTLLVALSVSGCWVFPTGDCTTILLYGLHLTVVDAATGNGVASGGVIRAIDGTFQDSVAVTASATAVAPQEYSLIPERAGSYQLIVTFDGYAQWTVTNVHITKDGCHVAPVDVTARLTRAP